MPVPAAAPSPRAMTPALAFKPPEKVLARLSTKVPFPALLKPAEPKTRPDWVTVDCGLTMVSVRVDEPRPIEPRRKRLWPESGPPRLMLPATVIGLTNVRTVPSDRN